MPTAFPVRLLTAVAKSMFVHLQMPSIMLLEAPVMVAIAAGTRSALVVDLGWHECVVSVVFELRVVGVGGRSRRGGKALREIWKAMLEREGASGVSDAEVEEVLARVGWCREYGASSGDNDIGDGSTIEIPLSTTSPPAILRLPFTKLSAPADKTFFANTTVDSPSPDYPDDDDLPLQDLVYRVLRNTPIDVRAAAMQRIAIVGGAAQTPNLKRRIIDEVRATVRRRGWDRVGKRPSAKQEEKTEKTKPKDLKPEDVSYHWRRETTASPEEDERAEVEGENRKSSEKPGTISGVESLGSWVGASLVAGMKVRGLLEVERDKFLATVVAGGSGFPLDF